eukprot:GHVN01044406.1.p1 GENE.GHVN01044406.1~~GHVN01044406.1.p1  ORF type:complete len:111 (-),score=6.06 GHVN01044406.1:236-568(-)
MSFRRRMGLLECVRATDDQHVTAEEFADRFKALLPVSIRRTEDARGYQSVTVGRLSRALRRNTRGAYSGMVQAFPPASYLLILDDPKLSLIKIKDGTQDDYEVAPSMVNR